MLERFFNAVGLIYIFLILIAAFVIQLSMHELPCPLCLLQRFGYLGIALGFFMNLRSGMHPSHYAIIILSALFVDLTALQQIAIFAVPGSGSYGSPLFELHLYTWSFVLSIVIIAISTLLMAIDTQYQFNCVDGAKPYTLTLTHVFAVILILLVLANIANVLFQCGLEVCPSNPTQYIWPF